MNIYKDSQASAWMAIADHIKDVYMQKFGAQAWYDLLDSGHASGIDAYKAAVTQLAALPSYT